jgi:thioredoxin reductase (NADPH)
MSAYLIDQIMRLPNVELRLNTEVIDADGQQGLEQVTLRDRTTGAHQVVPTAALFVMIGALPHTDWLRDTIECDASGFILTGTDVDDASRGAFDGRSPMLLETSMPGVFAAGDVRYGSTKRIAGAAGEAAVAIAAIHQYFQLTRTAPVRTSSPVEAAAAPPH